MNSFARSATLTSVLIAGALFLSGCDKGTAASAAPAPISASPVTGAVAQMKDVPIYLDTIGRTIAMQTVSIVPQIDGKVTAVHVENGAFVKKGDLLFEIDSRPFDAALATAKASLAEHQAEIAWAQSDFKRTEELMASNVASQLEFDQKKSNLGVIQAKIDAAQAEIKSAELDVEYTKIYSPVTGRAGVRLVDAGNVVKKNDAPMLVIQQLEPMYAEFTITENELGTVRKFMVARGMEVGNEASLGLTALVDVPGNAERVSTALSSAATRPATNPTEARQGTVTFMDNSVESNSGTVKLRATLPNADHYFWPGQFVNVRVVLATKKDAILIPAVAEQIGQQGPYVYVVKSAMVDNPQTNQKEQATIAEMHPIVPGQAQGDQLVVESGLSAGDTVIISGHLLVQPGGRVMVLNQAALGPAAQPQ